MLALLAVGGLRFSLPESLSAGPDWMLLAVVAVLLIPTTWARQRGRDKLNKFLGYLLSSIVTIDMIWSLGLLVAGLPAHRPVSSGTVAFRSCLMGYEHPGLRLVVLAFGRRWPARTRVARRTHRWSIPFPADDPRSAIQTRDGRAMLESRFCGLPLSRLQYQYRIFPNGLSRIISVGQSAHDDSIANFPDHGGSAGRSRSKYSLAARRMR